MLLLGSVQLPYDCDRFAVEELLDHLLHDGNPTENIYWDEIMHASRVDTVADLLIHETPGMSDFMHVQLLEPAVTGT